MSSGFWSSRNEREGALTRRARHLHLHASAGEYTKGKRELVLQAFFLRDHGALCV